MGLLAAYGVVPADCLQMSFFAAELSLEGECRPVRGILPMVIAAREKGLTSVFVARGNANEALLVEGVTVYVIDCCMRSCSSATGRSHLRQPCRLWKKRTRCFATTLPMCRGSSRQSGRRDRGGGRPQSLDDRRAGGGRRRCSRAA